MADDIKTPAGTGSDPLVATDEVGGRHFQQIKPNFGPDGITPTPVEDTTDRRFPVKVGELIGATNIAHGSANATTGGGQVVPARAKRRRVVITNKGDGGDVWLGGPGVTLSSGIFLPAIAGASAVVMTVAAVHAIADTTNATLGFLEEFD